MARDTDRLAPRAAGLLALLSLAYALVLVAGLATLPSPAHPIQSPWFPLMELLILGIAPAMLAFVASLQGWVPARGRPMALLALAFMGLCTVLTCAVHFVVFTVGDAPRLVAQPWWSQAFSFRWPSVVYALDILAWDLFFGLSALALAGALREVPGLRLVRGLLLGSGALALVGLAGVPLADMRVRNLGIPGYLLLFPVAALLLARVMSRSPSGRAMAVPGPGPG